MGILKAGLWAMLQDIRGMYSMLGYGLGFKSYVVCTQCWAMGYTLRKKDLFIVLREDIVIDTPQGELMISKLSKVPRNSLHQKTQTT
jgi:hypothetical protein